MRFIKVLFVSGLVFALMAFTSICILAVSGGNNDNLRKGLEQFLSDYTGRDAVIETLENAAFYPDLVMDVRNIALRRTANTPTADIRIDALDIRMRFWDAIFSRGFLSGFSMKGLSVDSSPVLPGSLAIEKAEIVTENGAAFLTGTGTYNHLPLSFRFGLEMIATSSAALYRLGPSSPVKFSVGSLEISATLRPVPGTRGFIAENLEITEKSGRVLAKGEASFTNGEVTLSATGGKTIFSVSLRHDETGQGLSGTVLLSELSMEDLAPGGALGTLAARAREIFVPQEKPKETLSDFSARIALIGENGAISSGPFSGPVQCAATLTTVKGTEVSLDPVWILRDGKDVTGTARYDLETQSFSGQIGAIANPKTLEPFLPLFAKQSPDCKTALKRWADRAP